MISELPTGWTLKSIKEICSEISDGNYSSKYPRQNEFLDSGIPFIRANNLVNNTVIWDDMRFISEGKHEMLKKGHLKENDVLITTRGVLGNVALVPKEFDDANINAQIVRMKTDETIIIPKYLLFSLKSKEFRSQLVKKTTGTTLKQLPVGKLEKMLIVLPPLNYQKKIVEILEKAEKLKEWRTEANELTYNYLNSLFLEMFGDPGENEKEWDFKTVEDLMKEQIIIGIKDGNHGERHPKADDFVDEGIPFIFANSISNLKLDLEKAPKITEETKNNLRVGFAQANDLLLSHKGSIGFSAVVPNNISLIVLSPQVTYYRLDLERLNPYFAQYYFQTMYFQKFFKRFAKQSTRDYVGITRQKKLKLFVPPITLQNQFAQIVQQLETLKTNQAQSKQEIDNLFNTLMQKAFKGELVC